MMRVLVVPAIRPEDGLLASRFLAAGHQCVCVPEAGDGAGGSPSPTYDVVVWESGPPVGEAPGLPGFGPTTGSIHLMMPVSTRSGKDQAAAAVDRLVALIRQVAAVFDGDGLLTRVLTCGDLEVDPVELRVTRGGRELVLTPTEYRVLETLIRHAGKPVSRQTLCEQVWSREWYGVTNVVDVYVSRVRRKVDRGRHPLVHTIRGVGYRLGPASSPAARRES
jgi:DNA-binding winged helix-turn-helix (wHTH) protein